MRLVARLGFLVLGLLATSGPAARAGDDVAARPIRFYRALSPAGTVTFFYPSFHLRDSRVPRPPMAMLDQVKRLVLEADIEDAKAHPAALARYIISPQPLDLMTLFTPVEIAGIRSRADCNGVGPMIERLRLSFIATMVALPCPKPDSGSYEEEVERAARQRGLDVTALESAAEEFEALGALPDRLFIEEIKEFAAHPADEDRMIEQMIALYNGADLDGLGALMTSSGFKSAADRKLFMAKVVLDRNRRMAERLAPVVAQGDALVVIGALHFPGKDGIIDLLKRQGIRVTAIDVTNGALR